MNYKNHLTLIIIKYVFLLCALMTFLSTGKDIDISVIIIFLLFVINNQLRMFHIKKNPVYYLSLISETVMLLFISDINIYLFFNIIFDSIIFLNPPISLLFPALSGVVILYKDLINLQTVPILLILTAFSVSMRIFLLKNDKLFAENENTVTQIGKLEKTIADLERYSTSSERLAILKERNRISREIHDSVGHSLSTIIIQLGAIATIAKKEPEVASDMANELIGFSKSGLEEIRMALRELKPDEYENLEFIFSIEKLIDDFKKLTDVDVRLITSKTVLKTSEANEHILYRAVQEFMSNSVRHGNATQIVIHLLFDNNEIILSMRDNGDGCDNFVKGLGITGIEERVREVGASVDYETAKGKGFSMRIRIK